MPEKWLIHRAWNCAHSTAPQITLNILLPWTGLNEFQEWMETAISLLWIFVVYILKLGASNLTRVQLRSGYWNTFNLAVVFSGKLVFGSNRLTQIAACQLIHCIQFEIQPREFPAGSCWQICIRTWRNISFKQNAEKWGPTINWLISYLYKRKSLAALELCVCIYMSIKYVYVYIGTWEIETCFQDVISR